MAVPHCPGSSAKLEEAKLWWPWQFGDPYLYEVEILDGDCAILRQPFGVRHSEVFYEPRTDGPAFRINGVRIFLAGVNWITTDQLLRFSTNSQRYEDEVRLMRTAGANVIRVWGGGIAERPEFYRACDRLGMLVYQEFWMTGDNNGAQAGSFSWPLDHQVAFRSLSDLNSLLFEAWYITGPQNHTPPRMWRSSWTTCKTPSSSCGGIRASSGGVGGTSSGPRTEVLPWTSAVPSEAWWRPFGRIPESNPSTLNPTPIPDFLNPKTSRNRSLPELKRNHFWFSMLVEVRNFESLGVGWLPTLHSDVFAPAADAVV